MLHASCLSACYFLSFRGQHGQERLGEMPEYGRDTQQPQHNAQRNPGSPAATLTQLLKVGNHLLERLLRFSLSMRGCLWDRLSTG